MGRLIIFVPFALAEVGREHFKDQTAAAGQTVIQSWSSAGLIQAVPQNPAQMCPSVNDSTEENEVNQRHAPELQLCKLPPRVIDTFSALAAIFLCASLYFSLLECTEDQ